MARYLSAGRQRGFTLIELILVIILLGILSVTAASRLIGRSSFDAYLARDQAISLARQIQLRAMSNINDQGDLNPCLSLLVAPDHFGPPACADTTFSGRAITASDDDITVTGDLLGEVRFDLLGRPYRQDGSGSKTPLCTTECQITFVSRNAQSASICINREGYIHACP
ncbi:prepilin-type N-terminal cleavage/methylation domain-containing protein [Photobacterium halotolerans]|uniref:prepilin-type N-terminal cleavage/methylation domain-containing protein n=1 Tax=Photobacterium halotolerans TaxID=265726 RepID=UPI0013731A40|nr:prepilin-type N-terminal cleavage/methylation domain-containing protein [Photobacterium halotolerans]NAW86805.1 prepilin-type N-terminal cleavage/methylation domain-containing protein [Photobacterium halotolerans]